MALEPLDASSISMQQSMQPNTPIHLYSSPSMAYLWNQYRCIRIMLFKCVRRLLSRQSTSIPYDPQTTSSINKDIPAARELPDLINGIIASVPYLLGEVDSDGSLKMPQQRRAVGALFILWPLKLLLISNLANSMQRIWISERLAYIRNVFGIQAATATF